MKNEEEQKAARLTLQNALKRKLYLYDYVGMIVLGLFDALLSGISLIIANNEGGTMGFLYTALAFAILAVLMLAWLSALYFVDADEAPSFAKIKMVAVVKDIFRSSGLGANAFLLVHALLENSKKTTSWNSFLAYDAIILLVIEGLFFFFGLWQNAWVRENPERYLSPVYPQKKKEGAPAPAPSAKPAPSKALNEPEKPALPQGEPLAIPVKKSQSKKNKK